MSRCETCLGEGGPGRPCPTCGALPPVEVVGLDDVQRGEVRRVTTPRRATRGAVVLILALVGLVGLSVAWESGGDDSADDDSADISTTTTTRPTSTAPPAPPPGRVDDTTPAPLLEPLPGFEDHWLVVASSRGAWQLPLGGGEPTRLGGLRDGEDEYLVDGHLIGFSGGVSLRGGGRWQIPMHSDRGVQRVRLPWVVGVTSTGSVVVDQETVLVEVAPDGTIVAEHPALAPGSNHTRAAGVAGRRVVYSGPHGLYALDLATSEVTRPVTGRFVAPVGEHAAIEVCDGLLRCGVQIMDLATGVTLVDLGPITPTGSRDLFVWMPPSVSPDLERLAILDGQAVAMFDLVAGARLGEVPIPPEVFDQARSGMVGINVLWASSSDAAVVIVTLRDGARSELALPVTALVDRDANEVRQRDDLRAAIGPLVGFGGAMSYFLSDEEFVPWAQ